MRYSLESSPLVTWPAGLAGLLGGVVGVTDGAPGLLRVVRLRGVAGVTVVLHWCPSMDTPHKKRKKVCFLRLLVL